MMLRVLLLLFICLSSVSLTAQKLNFQSFSKYDAGFLADTCYSSEIEESSTILPQNPIAQRYQNLRENNAEAARVLQDAFSTAEIIVNFSSNFDDFPLAKDAFRYAADLWELEIESNVPIIIDADITSMGSGVIGSNRSNLVTEVPNARDESVVYVASLGNSIAGLDLLPGEPDMIQTYNSDFTFYYGLDANPPASQTDFVSIVFHEIGHGMGITGGAGSGDGVGFNFGKNPYIWDTFVELRDETPVLDLPFGSDEQTTALRTALFIDSYNTNEALDGNRARIYTPFTFNPGSSFSHWDENTFPAGNPNSLMSPRIGSGEAIHDIGDITRGILRDMGWKIPAIDSYDVGVSEIISPVTNLNLGQEQIVVEVSNFGIEPVSRIPVAYRVDGGSWVIEVVNQEIQPRESITYTFQATADLSVSGTAYSIEARTQSTLDTQENNNLTSSEVFHQSIISSFPYEEGFENGSAGWQVVGDPLWELGEPNGNLLVAASEGSNAYATNLDGNYLDLQASAILSPVFDFTGKSDPTVEFDIWYDIEFGWDGFALQMSTDRGETWQTVGELGDGNNWYNDGPSREAGSNEGGPGIDALFSAGASGDGWTGISGVVDPEWITVRHVVSGASENEVMFRIFFASDQAFNEEGAGFDNFKVEAADLQPNDAGICAILSPLSGNLSSPQTVTVTVTNYGSESISDFDVSYQLNQESPVTETFTGTLNLGESVNYDFTTLLDISAPGSYSLISYTSLVNDQNTANDTSAINISSDFVINTFPYQESFEVNDGGWITSGENSSWSRGVPSAALINQASDGSNVFATNLSGNYNSDEDSKLTSPLFDLSGLSNTIFAADIWYESERNNDALVLQYSTDGVNWITLDNESVINWYTGFSLGLLTNAWTGSSERYQTVYAITPALDGQRNVRLRFLFKSNDSVENEGMAIDNVRIFSADQIPYSLTCSPDVQVSNDPGQPTAEVILDNPAVSGNLDPITYSNDLTGTSTAEGIFRIGSSDINFIVSSGPFVSTCSSSVTVLDNENPTLICTEDVTVAIPQGQTEGAFDYGLPIVSDNYGFEEIVTYSTDQEVDGTSGVVCPTGPNSYWRAFDLSNDFDISNEFSVVSVDVGIQVSTAGEVGDENSIPGFVNLYYLDRANYDPAVGFVLADLIFVESQPFDVEVGLENSLINVPITATLPADIIAVVEFNTPAGNQIFPGANPDQRGESFISASGCDINQPTNVREIDFPDAQWVINLSGVWNATAEPILTSGIGSGGVFPLGATTETYEITDVFGNTSTCSFDVILVETALEAPVATEPTDFSSTSITLTWNEVTGITQYQYFLSSDNFSSYVPGHEGTIVSGGSIQITDLEPNTTYQYKVRTVDADPPTTFSPFSNIIRTSTLIDVPVLSNVNVISNGSAEVTWGNIQNITDYDVALSQDNFTTIEAGYPIEVSGTDMILGNLESDTEYEVRVRAKNSARESDYSTGLIFRTMPSTPRALSASAVTSNELVANWQEVPEAVEYKVIYGTGNLNEDSELLDSVFVSTNSTAISGLQPNTTYKYEVIAISSSALGSMTSNRIRTTTEASAPVALDPEEITSFGATLFWNQTRNVLTYEFDLSTDNFATSVTGYNAVPVNDTTILITGLEAETAYQYRVRAINKSGSVSSNSNAVTFTTTDNSGAPPVPQILDASEVDITSFVANWQEVAESEFYEIEVINDDIQDLQLMGVVFNTSRSITDLNDNNQYSYRVRAYNNTAYSDWSDPAIVRTILSINDFEESVSFYPNPVRDKLILQMPQDFTGSAVIFDSSMKELLNTPLKEGFNEIKDFAAWNPGLYIIHLTYGNQVKQLKIIKQ